MSPTHLRDARALATALLALVAGCGPRTAAVKEATKAAATSRSVTAYKLVGEVRAVEAKAGRVRIRHEAVPDFMPAMDMWFTLKGRDALDDVRPGDGVEATLRVEREGGEVKDYELTDLDVVRPAPPGALTLNLSGGRPEVAAAPKTLRPGEEVPDFAMTDQDGETRRLSEFRGNAVALTFLFTRCPLPDFCPRLDRKFSDVAGRIAAVPGRGERLRLLSVSFDPAHDTPAVLKQHARSRGASPPLWTFASAPHAELARVAPRLGLVYGPVKDEFVHNLVIAVIDPEGRLVRLETGAGARDWDPGDLLRAMYSSVPRTGKSSPK